MNPRSLPISLSDVRSRQKYRYGMSLDGLRTISRIFNPPHQQPLPVSRPPTPPDDDSDNEFVSSGRQNALIFGEGKLCAGILKGGMVKPTIGRTIII
jgi:hypothetical protein